ncbi:hypothetical protein PFISCL1PPCAC_1289, partial [Pristionchus fissidentatus]
IPGSTLLYSLSAMVQVSDAAVESAPPKSSFLSSSKSPFTLLNAILASLAVIFFTIAVVFITLFFTSNNGSQQAGKAEALQGNPNPPLSCPWMRQCEKKRAGVPPLLVISMDGFANRYINWRDTPTIKKLGECGGRAEFMYPSFPSKTFPNHYTIATGMYPGSHGIVDNVFYTPNLTKYNTLVGSFYSGEPIWNTVVKNGKISKAFMWLGSYDKINGVEASFHHTIYQEGTKEIFVDRIDNVTDWLISDDPPALSMLYMEEPDKSGHSYGPDSEEV